MGNNDKVNTIRVLHYIGSLEFGGSQAFVMELYRNIDRNKLQFDFVTFPDPSGPLYDEILSLGGKVFECPKYNGINHMQFVRWWHRFLKDHAEYYVIHGHVRSVASIYLPIVRQYHRFTILHSHSASNGRGVAGVVKYMLQFPVRHQADYYMACSEKAGEWLFGEKVIHSNKYKTVPNAINAERFTYDNEVRTQVRKEYGIDNYFCIGHIGRFSEVKNHEFLLQVLGEVLKIDNNVRLLLVGDGILKPVIEQKAKDMGLWKYVIFAGARLDTERYYQAMDVFAFPSLWEGLGIVVIEAQASGLPCVVSEGVPKEVDLNVGLVTRAKLDNSGKWAELITGYREFLNSRCTHTEYVKKAGYDIRVNAHKMQTFYLKNAEIVANQF